MIGYDMHTFEVNCFTFNTLSIFERLKVYSEFSKVGPLRASDRTFYNNNVKITGNHGMYVFQNMILKGAHHLTFT